MSSKARGFGSREWFGLTLASALAIGCAAASPAAPEAPAGRRVAPAPTPLAAPALDTHGLTLEALPVASRGAAAPVVKIVEPAPEEALSAELAPRKLLRLELESAPLTSEREGVLVALDGNRPRRVLDGRSLTLSDLLPLGTVLSPGPHVLLAVALGPEGRTLRTGAAADKSFSLVRFFVGARPATASDSTPRSVFCLSPVGTAYTKPGESLLFEVLAFGVAPAPSKVRVQTARFEAELPFDPSRAFALRGLPPGDARLSVGSEPLSECVVTVNPLPEAGR